MSRVSTGEVLYRDVAFGATPLSVQLTVFLTSLFGLQALVLRALLAACLVAAVLLSGRILRQSGRAGRTPALLAVALFVCAGIGARPPYSSVANLLLLGSFLAALAADPFRGAVASGFLAGLAFADKQNVGLLTLAAALGAAVLAGPTLAARLRRVAAALGGFAAGAILPILSVAFQGGLPGLLDFGFLGKGAYVALGRVSVFEGLAPLGSFLDAPSLAWEPLGAAFQASLFLVPPVAGAALALAFRCAPLERRRGIAVAGLFLLAALLGLFPRADAPHLVYVMPVVLAALAYAVHDLRATPGNRIRRVLVAAAWCWVAAGLATRVAPPLRGLADGTLHVSTLPHFRGVLISTFTEDEIRRDAVVVAAWASSGGPGALPLFLLSPNAGLYYLVTGTRNSTRFDYPWITTFGRAGERELGDAIAEGRLRVLVDHRFRSPMSPATLERLAAARLRTTATADVGTLYVP